MGSRWVPPPSPVPWEQEREGGTPLPHWLSCCHCSQLSPPLPSLAQSGKSSFEAVPPDYGESSSSSRQAKWERGKEGRGHSCEDGGGRKGILTCFGGFKNVPRGSWAGSSVKEGCGHATALPLDLPLFTYIIFFKQYTLGK